MQTFLIYPDERNQPEETSRHDWRLSKRVDEVTGGQNTLAGTSGGGLTFVARLIMFLVFWLSHKRLLSSPNCSC